MSSSMASALCGTRTSIPSASRMFDAVASIRSGPLGGDDVVPDPSSVVIETEKPLDLCINTRIPLGDERH